MPSLFPPEIIQYSAENYYSKLRTKSQIIYSSVLLFVISTIAALPFIKIDISTQARGVIRTPMENILLQLSVSGEVIEYSIHENKTVFAGDTLIVFNTAQLDEQISLETEKKQQNDRLYFSSMHSITGNGE